MKTDHICTACGHPASAHGTEAQLAYGPQEGCQTGVWRGGFGRRLVVCLCDVPFEELTIQEAPSVHRP